MQTERDKSSSSPRQITTGPSHRLHVVLVAVLPPPPFISCSPTGNKSDSPTKAQGVAQEVIVRDCFVNGAEGTRIKFLQYHPSFPRVCKLQISSHPIIMHRDRASLGNPNYSHRSVSFAFLTSQGKEALRIISWYAKRRRRKLEGVELGWNSTVSISGPARRDGERRTFPPSERQLTERHLRRDIRGLNRRERS